MFVVVQVCELSMCMHILCGCTLGPYGPLQAEKESIVTAITASKHRESQSQLE